MRKGTPATGLVVRCFLATVLYSSQTSNCFASLECTRAKFALCSIEIGLFVLNLHRRSGVAVPVNRVRTSQRRPMFLRLAE